MASNDILGLDGQEDSKGHAAATSSEGLGSVKRSLCSKLLGISLAAQLFSIVSAEGICHPFGKVKQRFDLIGLISVLRIPAAAKSLSYSALNDGCFYLTGHIGPGSLSVAAMLFEATSFRLARLLAFGGGGSIYDLVELGFSNGLRYIGLKSNTECPVANAVGESVVREHQALWKEKQGEESEGLMASTGGEQRKSKRKGRDAKRQLKVIILKLGSKEEEESRRTEEVLVSLKTSTGGVFFLGWLPLLLTIGVIARCYLCKEWFVAGLITLGTLGMMVSVMGLRLCAFKYSKPQVARGAPEGDCLVVDDTDPDTLHVILGDEECIQTLFQRKIDHGGSFGKDLMCLGASILYVYVIASVFNLPNVSTRGQIFFAIANVIGLVADVLKASHNGKLGLAKTACDQFKIVARDVIVFQNRTAAVACVAKHCKDPSMLKSKKLLPCDGPVWEKWWEVLAKCDGEVDKSLVKSAVGEAEEEDQKLLQALLDDMTEGLESG